MKLRCTFRCQYRGRSIRVGEIIEVPEQDIDDRIRFSFEPVDGKWENVQAKLKVPAPSKEADTPTITGEVTPLSPEDYQAVPVPEDAGDVEEAAEEDEDTSQLTGAEMRRRLEEWGMILPQKMKVPEIRAVYEQQLGVSANN